MTLSSEVDLRQQLIIEARSLIGTKWRHQGRSLKGVDCIGLVLLPAVKLGLCDYPDDYNYPRVAVDRELISIAREWAREIRLGPGGLGDVPDGDIVVLRDRTFPQHVGMMSTLHGQRTLIHSSLAHRRVVEEYIIDDHRKLALTSFRFRVFT